MKNLKTIGFSFLLAAAFGATAFCQSTRSSEQSLVVNFLQIKEGLNHGLVFRGFGLQYQRLWEWENDQRLVSYEAGIGLAAPTSRGIIGAQLHLLPGRVSYLRKTGGVRDLAAGLFFTGEYNYQMYPDLQSGYSFWLTHYSVGGALAYPFEAGGQLFEVKFRTTLLGATSRPEVERGEYFFDASLGDMVRYLHQDFQFGTWNRYNQTGLEIRWQPKADARLAFAYGMNYYGYFKQPRLTMIDQSLKLIFLPK
ncbi:MAG: hypothetical protein AAB316_02630 [Bacteroidota bacterium]